MDSEKEPVQEPHKTPPLSPSIGKRLLRWFLGFLSFLFVLLLAVQAIFWVYTDEIIGNALKQLVLTKSKGLYYIGYDNIELNVLTGNLDITEFFLKADSSHYDRINKRWFTENKVYEVEVTDVNVKGAHIAEIYFQDQLNIDEISIKEPTVSIYNYLIDTLRSDELKANNFFYLISDYLKLFRIDDFNVEYGSVGIEHYNDSIKLYQTLENIALSVNGFQIDSTSHLKDGRPFNVNDITFEIEYNTFNIKGIPYELKVGKIKGGTKEESLNLKNIAFTPWESAKNKKRLNQIRIPELDVTGFNYRKAYFNNIIEIKKVAFNSPDANLKSFKLPRQNPGSSIADSINYLKVFKSLAIDTISLNEGNIIIDAIQRKERFYLPLSNLTLNLVDFHIDSTTSSQSFKKLEFFKNADIVIKNLELKLPDSLHRLRAREVYFSTTQKKIYSKGLRIYPRYRRSHQYFLKKYNKNKLLDISIPYFGINNIDAFQTYFQKKLSAKNIRLFMPEINILNHPEIEISDTSTIDFNKVSDLISPYLKSIEVNDFIIDKGAIKITDHKKNTDYKFQVKSFDLKLNKIFMDTSVHLNEGNLFFTSNLNLTASELLHNSKDSLQQLKISQIKFSSADSSFSLKGFHYNPIFNLQDTNFTSHQITKELIDFNINNVHVSGLDMRRAFHDQVFIIDSLKLQQGNTGIYQTNAVDSIKIKYDSLNNQNLDFTQYFKFAKIKELEFENISFKNYSTNNYTNARHSIDSVTAYFQNINIDGFSFNETLSNLNDTIHIDSTTFITDHSEVIRLNHAVVLGKNLNIPLSDSSNHFLKIKELGAATLWKSLFAEGVRILPDTLIKNDSNNIYEIAIPYVWVDSVDLREFYYNKKLHAKRVSLVEPFALIDLISKQNKSTNKSINLEKLYELIEGKLELISIDQFNIEEAGLDILLRSGNETQNFYSSDVDITIKNFILDSTSHLTPNRFLYSDDIDIRIKDYNQTLADSLHSLEISKLVFSSSDSKLYAENIGLFPEFEISTEKPSDKNLFDIYIPNIKIDTFNLYDLYVNNDLDVKKIEINAPNLNLKLHSTDNNNQAKIKPDNWYKLLSPFLHKLNIKDFKFNDLKIGITNDNAQDATHLEKISGQIKGFALDSSSRNVSGNLMYSEDVNLTLDNYSMILPDSMYLVKIGRVGFSTQNEELYFDDIHLAPIYDKYEFSRQVGHETDYMNLSSGRITLKEIDFYNLLEKKELRSKTLIFDGFKGELFRDKRLPPDEEWFPPTPQQTLINSPYLINIDTLLFRNGYIAYEEFATNGISPGEIFFNDLNVTAFNITNDPELLKQGIAVNIYASCYVMGEGLLQSSLNFPLTDPYGSFSYKGTVQKMDITKLNPILEKIAFVKVASGTNNKLAFNINANDHYSKGIVRFYYDDFKIDIINANKSDVERKKRAMISFFANAVLNNRNPRLLFLKKGKVYFERNNRRSVFHYLVHSLLSGIRPSVGLSSKSKIPKGERKYDKAEFGE